MRRGRRWIPIWRRPPLRLVPNLVAPLVRTRLAAPRPQPTLGQPPDLCYRESKSLSNSEGFASRRSRAIHAFGSTPTHLHLQRQARADGPVAAAVHAGRPLVGKAGAAAGVAVRERPVDRAV